MSWGKLKRVLEEGMSVVAEQEAAAKVDVLAALLAAAEAFVAEVERRVGAEDPAIDLDLTEAFKGLVMDAAKKRFGADDKDAVKKAFLLLGKDNTVKSRNHLATYEREAEKVRALLAALAPKAETSLAAPALPPVLAPADEAKAA